MEVVKKGKFHCDTFGDHLELEVHLKYLKEVKAENVFVMWGLNKVMYVIREEGKSCR